MTYPHGGAGEIWRDGTAGAYNPKKSEIRSWGAAVEVGLTQLQARDFATPNPKAPVGAVAVSNIALSGEQVIDGVQTAASRVLVIGQTDPAQNGVYVTAAGAWGRAADCASGESLEWATVFVDGGTFHAGTHWICAASAISLGSDALPWVQVGGGFPVLENFNAALSEARRQFELEAEKWFRAAFLTQNFEVEPVAKGAVVSFETSATDGDVHLVILPAGSAEPVRGEIAAGTDGDGLPAVYAAALPVVSLDIAFEIPRILANGTAYDLYAFHQNAAGDLGRRHKGAFTTPIILSGGAYDGSLGDLNAYGVAVTEIGQLDSVGGVNAIRFQDSGLGGSGIAGVQTLTTLQDGLNKASFLFKKVSGSFDRVQYQNNSYSSVYTAEIDVATGALVSSDFPVAPAVTALEDGWFKVQAEINALGWADKSGFIRVVMRQGGSSSIAQDGTQICAVQDFYVEGHAGS